MDLIFFNTPGAAQIDFGKPVYKRIWLSIAADMTPAVVEVLKDVPIGVSGVFVEDCLVVEINTLSKPARFFSAPPSENKPAPRRIAFFAASDTLSFLLSPVIQEFKKNNKKASVCVWHRERQNERAKEGFESNGIKSTPFSFWSLLRLRPEVLVLGNDWTADAQLMIALGRFTGMRTVCLQESVIDLADPVRGRMRWADFALLQGAVACKQLPERSLLFLTGNPRYEKLEFQRTGNARPFFLVNCNFTYGVHEDQRQNWLDPVIESLENLNAAYVIAQHPRDTGDLSGYKNVVRTNAAVIHELIGRSDCIISRFSSVLHEGIFLEKRAIYFNPHGESVGYDYGFDNAALFYASDQVTLGLALNTIMQSPDPGPEIFRVYLEKNCHYGLGKPAETIAKLLPDLVDMKGDGKRISLLKALWSTLKFYYFPKK